MLETEFDILREYGMDVSDIVNPQLREYSPGEVLFDDGDEAEELFFLAQGTVKTLIPAKGHAGFLLGRYVNRGVFDDTVLFREDGRCHIRAVCETDARLIVLPFKINAPVLREQNSFLQKMAENYALYIDQVMNSFYFQKYPFEYMMCSYIAVNRSAKEWVPDFEQMCADLDTPMRMIERCLALLVNKGVLTKGKTGYFITDPILFEEYNKGLYQPKQRR